jgi:hypothetical protein
MVKTTARRKPRNVNKPLIQSLNGCYSIGIKFMLEISFVLVNSFNVLFMIFDLCEV